MAEVSVQATSPMSKAGRIVPSPLSLLPTSHGTKDAPTIINLVPDIYGNNAALLPTITENNVFVLDLITFIPMGLLFLFLPHTILKLISNYQYKKIKNYWPNQTTIADDGIEIKNNLFQAFYKWKSFTKYWDGNDCFYIFINPYQAIIIPKRDIHNKLDINTIANKLQKEIKLVKT